MCIIYTDDACHGRLLERGGGRWAKSRESHCGSLSTESERERTKQEEKEGGRMCGYICVRARREGVRAL